jgi:predicted nucleic-acid-binding protein
VRAADTNVLVRILVRDDPEQAAAADAWVAPGAWVPHVVLAETAWALEAAYGIQSSRIADALEMLLDHASLTLEDPEVVAASVALFRA